MDWVDAAGIWGAVLATLALGIELWRSLHDRPILKINAAISSATAGKDRVAYGTRIETEHGEKDFFVGITIRNHGKKSFQIAAVFVETQILHQVRSLNLPAILEPGCLLETRIQKEWLDDPETTTFGVLDGLGRRHAIPHDIARSLIEVSRKMPTNRCQYRKKDDPNAPPVWAWQLQDNSVIASRESRELS